MLGKNALAVAPLIEVTQAMIDAGVKAIYAEMGYQLEGSVEDGVAAAVRAALRQDYIRDDSSSI